MHGPNDYWVPSLKLILPSFCSEMTNGTSSPFFYCLDLLSLLPPLFLNWASVSCTASVFK